MAHFQTLRRQRYLHKLTSRGQVSGKALNLKQKFRHSQVVDILAESKNQDHAYSNVNLQQRYKYDHFRVPHFRFRRRL